MVTVSKEITRLEHSAIKLTITMGKDDVSVEYNKMLTDYCKNVQIPGFRKGKVPRVVLERKLGDALKKEVLAHILELATAEVFEDEDFPRADRPLPYSYPQVQGEPVLDLEADLVFSVIYDVMPQVVLGQWKGFEVEVPDVSITDEDISRELEVIRDRNAIVQDRDDGIPAVKDDVVTVNYSELTDDGAVAAGTSREDFVFTLGSGYNVFKFDDDVLGMKKGETKDIEKSYPEDFEDAELAGKTKKIRVTLAALKEKKLPDLDDEFAQDVDEKYKTLDDLKESVRERLAKELEKQLKVIKINKLLEKAMEAAPVDIPESMIRFELDTRKRAMARNMNVSVDVISSVIEHAGGQWLDIWRPEAIKALHSRFIVEAIVKELGFQVTEEEVKKHIETAAAESGSSVEDLTAYYEKEPNIKSMLEEDLKENKLFERLLAENTVKVGNSVNYLEFMANNG